MTPLDLLIARTQRHLTFIYWLLFAAVLGALIFVPRPLDDSVKTLLITMAGILGTLVTMQNQFWFARQRTAGVPDPTTTTTTTTKIDPGPPATIETTTTPAPPVPTATQTDAG